MTWEKPSFREVNMNSEIGAYQEDLEEREVHGAKNNERHVRGRRRVGEPAVSSAQPRETETYLKQYGEGPGT
jgi:hypothetical protein